MIDPAVVLNYPEPEKGSREDAIARALGAHGKLERVKMTTSEQTATGPALSEWFTWLLDVWRLVDRLPSVQSDILKRAYLDDPVQSDAAIGKVIGLSLHQVKRLRWRAIRALADHIWPDEEPHALTS